MIKKIKVSPSLLDAFDNVLTGRYNETEQRLLDKINKVAAYQQTEAMSMGTAMDLITESYNPLRIVKNKKTGLECYEFEFWEFNRSLVDDLRDIRDPFYHQVWVERFIDTPYGPVKFYGKTDDLGGGHVQDLKTCKQYMGGLSYYDAWQWKLYLYCANAHAFTYVITDYTNIYFEEYQPRPDNESLLRSHTVKYIEFLNDNRDKINLDFITYQH
jgi:hypothetical protein